MYLGSLFANVDEIFTIPVGESGNVIEHCEIRLYNQGS